MQRLNALLLPGAMMIGLPFFLAACTRGHYAPMPGPGHLLTLTVNGKTLQAEVVEQEEARRVGLMFRKAEEFPEDRAMLFIFPDLRKQSFWMRNVAIPLSIAFISEEGEILQIEDMRPYDERFTESKNKVRYALEVNQGWFGRNGVNAGMRFDDFVKKLENRRR
ncbi:MAG: DUF192 domain-containing protein [Planctomycetes bacterium]|nr:DUF192 domain-containing protein [Planctomycetota bacterium]